MIAANFQEAILALIAQYWLPVVAFAAGTFFGHWLAVRRDRRRERNEAASPWRAHLIAQVDRPAIYRGGPSAAERAALLGRVSFWRRALINAAWQRYCDECKAQTQCNELNEPSYKDPAAVALAASQCLRLIKIW